MAYKLRPLDLELSFEKRDYRLGETIDLEIDLRPRADINVRGARIDLVCEQHYVMTAVTFIPDTYATHVISGQTKGVSEQRTERFVQSTVAFLDATSLSGGTPSRHRAGLLIQPTPPPRLADAWELTRDANSSWSFKWTLVATIDVVLGRNPKAQRVVSVKLPSRAEAGA